MTCRRESCSQSCQPRTKSADPAVERDVLSFPIKQPARSACATPNRNESSIVWRSRRQGRSGGVRDPEALSFSDQHRNTLPEAVKRETHLFPYRSTALCSIPACIPGTPLALSFAYRLEPIPFQQRRHFQPLFCWLIGVADRARILTGAAVPSVCLTRRIMEETRKRRRQSGTKASVVDEAEDAQRNESSSRVLLMLDSIWRCSMGPHNSCDVRGGYEMSPCVHRSYHNPSTSRFRDPSNPG